MRNGEIETVISEQLKQIQQHINVTNNVLLKSEALDHPFLIKELIENVGALDKLINDFHMINYKLNNALKEVTSGDDE